MTGFPSKLRDSRTEGAVGIDGAGKKGNAGIQNVACKFTWNQGSATLPRKFNVFVVFGGTGRRNEGKNHPRNHEKQEEQ